MSIETPIEAQRRAIPGWALTVTVVLLFLGAGYYATNLGGENPPIGGRDSGPPGPNPMALIERAGCQACHAADLTGAIGPDLHGVANGPVSENLQELGTAHPEDWANLWIAGVDPDVADLDRGGMPAFGGPDGQLSDDEITVIVEYLKTLE